MFLDKIYDKKPSSAEKGEAIASAVNSKLLNEQLAGAPSQADITLIGDRATLSSIIILLSYIRHYVSSGSKGDIMVKIGYNKPAGCPLTFSVNEQLLDDIYPGQELEIN